ncbi:unnamed protein product [Auanema sp. JU1783]|nr:unnamed protein product [Auanema sp. JU1783]
MNLPGKSSERTAASSDTKENSPRFNGLINKKGLDISAAEDGKGVVVSTKKSGKANQPAKSVKTQVFKNPMKTTKSIGNLASNLGLGSQAKLAQRVASAIIRSQRPKSKKHVKKTEA